MSEVTDKLKEHFAKPPREAFHIDVEEILCILLGKPWSLTGISIETLSYELAAALSKRIPEGWRPISEAPKDGTPVLLVGQSINAMIPQTGFFHDAPHLGAHWWLDDGENCRMWHDGKPTKIENPTHWMPLPEPPNPENNQWLR